MEEPFCNQAKAYKTRAVTEANLDALIVYEQFKETIEVVERSLNDDEKLSVLWYRPTGTPIILEKVGYQAQAFLVFSGKDETAIESMALVSANLVQVVLQVAKREPGDARKPVAFMGHSVRVI